MFKRIFLEKIVDDKTPAMLLKEMDSLTMEPKEKVKEFNQRFNHILNNFTIDTKPHDSITVDYYTSALSTNIVDFIKQAMKPMLSENFQEAIDMEKDLCMIGVIVDDKTTKDSKDARRRSQATMSKVKEKETSEIETLTRLLKSLMTEVAKLKQRTTETTMSNRPSSFARRKNVTSGSNSSHPTKYVQSSNVVFQTDLILKENIYEFHKA